MMSKHPLMSALLAALFLSGACTYLLSRKITAHAATPSAPDHFYVTASRTVQAGELIKAEDVVMMAWPAAQPVSNAFAHVPDVAGRVALYPLEKGRPIVESELAAPGSAVGLAGKIPKGMRAIALRSDEVVGVAGFLTPGSHLDVLVSYHTEKSPEPVTATVLQNARVLAAGQQIEPDPAGKPAAVTVVTLLLTPEESERAFLASTQGAIHFILRNNIDEGRERVAPVNLSQLAPDASAGSGSAYPQRSIANQPVPKPVRTMQIETVLGGSDADNKPLAKPDGGW